MAIVLRPTRTQYEKNRQELFRCKREFIALQAEHEQFKLSYVQLKMQFERLKELHACQQRAAVDLKRKVAYQRETNAMFANEIVRLRSLLAPKPPSSPSLVKNVRRPPIASVSTIPASPPLASIREASPTFHPRSPRPPSAPPPRNQALRHNSTFSISSNPFTSVVSSPSPRLRSISSERRTHVFPTPPSAPAQLVKRRSFHRRTFAISD